MMTKAKPGQFDIYWVGLDPVKGQEMKKTRPCVVVSPDVMNGALGTLIVVPLTSTITDWPFRMVVSAAGQKSSLACDQIRTISKGRLGQKIGSLKPAERRQLTGLLQEIFA